MQRLGVSRLEDRQYRPCKDSYSTGAYGTYIRADHVLPEPEIHRFLCTFWNAGIAVTPPMTPLSYPRRRPAQPPSTQTNLQFPCFPCTDDILKDVKIDDVMQVRRGGKFYRVFQVCFLFLVLIAFNRMDRRGEGMGKKKITRYEKTDEDQNAGLIRRDFQGSFSFEMVSSILFAQRTNNINLSLLQPYSIEQIPGAVDILWSGADLNGINCFR